MSGITKPTLTYFNLAGRGEGPRVSLELAGVDYSFHAISFKGSAGDDWADYKSKHADVLTFGQLPLYQEPGGINLVQTGSIQRYIARKYGLNGSNDQEANAIDVLYEGTGDLFTAILKTFFAEESKKAEEVNKLLTDSAPKLLAHFQRALEHNNGGSGFLVGNKVSYADVNLFLALKNLSSIPGGKDLVEKHGLAAFYDRIANLPNIKKYHDSEPYKH